MIIKKHLPQIESLRALAVISVVFFHFEIFNFSGGFVGVDIFYVISGYLFTSIIISDLKNKKFNLYDFYLRRVRRILPLLYLTVVTVLILGSFLFNNLHYERLIHSSFSAITFVSNFFFTSEAGYFDNDKIFKPLLHTWSLSVEIQFYIIWPIIVFLSYKIFKDNFLIAIIVIFSLSLFLSLILSPRFEGYFYNPFLRLFEFIIGSFCIFFNKEIVKRYSDTIFIIGLSLILYCLFFFRPDDVFPGYNSLIPCIGAFLIIISSNNLIIFKNFFINKFFTYLGKISYSIYLIHWPVLVYFNYLYFEKNNFVIKIFLTILTIFLSSLSYRYIEEPFRSKDFSKFNINNLKILSFLTVIFFIISTSNLHLDKLRNYFVDTSKSEKIDKNISKTRNIFNKVDSNQSKKIKDEIYFQNKNSKNILLIGDSHGLDLYITLDKNNSFSEFEKIYYDYRRFYCFKKDTKHEKAIKFIRKIVNKKNTCQIILNEYQDRDFLNYELISAADIVIIHESWVKDLDLSKLKNFIQKYDDTEILLVNRRPQFIDIPTLYTQTSGNLNLLAKKYSNNSVITINEMLKDESKKNNINYFDIFQLICAPNECKVIHDNEILITDKYHWSLFGWFYYGKMLEKSELKKILLNIM